MFVAAAPTAEAVLASKTIRPQQTEVNGGACLARRVVKVNGNPRRPHGDLKWHEAPRLVVPASQSPLEYHIGLPPRLRANDLHVIDMRTPVNLSADAASAGGQYA